jgi:DNA-binding Lrp family transcriptional regulator
MFEHFLIILSEKSLSAIVADYLFGWVGIFLSKGKGIEAYELIVAEHGADDEVLHALINIEGVAEASLVYGEFDIHCKIEVENMDKLKEVITKIRKLKVITTETLIAYDRISKRISRVSNRLHKRMHHKRARR